MVDGTVLARSAAFVTPLFVANHEIVAALGAQTESTALGTCVKTDPGGRTSVPGVWAVGNVADVAAFVVEAAAAGAEAAEVSLAAPGAAVSLDLLHAARATAANRDATRRDFFMITSFYG